MATLTPPPHAQPLEHELKDQNGVSVPSSSSNDIDADHRVNGHSSQVIPASEISSSQTEEPIPAPSSSALPPTKPLQLSPIEPAEMPTQTTTITATSTSPAGDAIIEKSSPTIATVAEPLSLSHHITTREFEAAPAPVSEDVQAAQTEESLYTPAIAEGIGQPVLSDERSVVTGIVASTDLDDSILTETVTVDAPVAHPEGAATSQVTEVIETVQPSEQDSAPVDEAPTVTVPTPAKLDEERVDIPVTQADAAEPKLEEQEVTVTPIPLDTTEPTNPSAPSEPLANQPFATDRMEDVLQDSGKIARGREEDDDEEAPDAKRTKTDEHSDLAAVDDDAKDGKIKLNTTMTTSASQAAEDVIMAETSQITTPGGDTAEVLGPVEAAAEGASASDSLDAAAAEDWGSMTDAQLKQLKMLIQNLRKGRNSQNFNKPVDPVALNIPTYFDIVKTPMDLSTMDKKLKESQYGSVNDFINDFSLIVDNCIKFNGAQHAISMTAMNLKAHFGALLKKVPRAGEALPPPPSKERRPSIAQPPRDAKRRTSRPSVGAATSPTTPATNQTFALGQDGIPLTRRTSTHDGRPKREINKPPPRDLPYLSAPPKKKKYQMELKFCEHVLGELKRGRYADWMLPFARPVDPVALNIPDYHKHVKKPMDFQTITEKLQNNHYSTAKEFETDVKLVFQNCYKFNGSEHPVSQSGKALEAAFDEMWNSKQTWIQQNTPASAPQSPEAESEEDEEEEEEEEEEVDRTAEMEKAAEIASLNQKIAELSAQVMGLVNSKPIMKPKASKKKAEKGKKAADSNTKAKRKSSGTTAGGASGAKQEKKTSKPKAKPKPITMKDKAEIAERIGELSIEETAKAAELIKAGLRKIGKHELADRPDEELEFDIESIPEEVLHSLLKLVRKNDAPKDNKPTTTTSKSSGPAKPKKNKPMGKQQQEDAIRRIEQRIGAFQDAGAGQDADGSRDVAVSSGDEEDSGSESEEE